MKLEKKKAIKRAVHFVNGKGYKLVEKIPSFTKDIYFSERVISHEKDY